MHANLLVISSWVSIDVPDIPDSSPAVLLILGSSCQLAELLVHCCGMRSTHAAEVHLDCSSFRHHKEEPPACDVSGCSRQYRLGPMNTAYHLALTVLICTIAACSCSHRV